MQIDPRDFAQTSAAEGRAPDDAPAPHDRAEKVVTGVAVAPGIAIGTAFRYAREEMTVSRRAVSDDEVDDEVSRFERAVSRAERDLNKIASVAREKLGQDSASIFEAQALMLRDEALYAPVVDFVRDDHVNAEYAVDRVMSRHRRLLKESDSEYLRERANDLLDVQDRVIRHLRRGKLLSDVPAGSIVVAPTLTAADVILFSRRQILGCAMDYGGATSHVSIMARALGVPAVVSTHSVTETVETGDVVILDGLDGRIVVNPKEKTLSRYRERQRRYQRFLEEQRHLVPLPSETLDQHGVVLRANLEFQEELELLEKYGARGIGLFRTEILFLMQGRLSVDEDEQFEIYQRIVETVAPEPVTFRVLDLGGDKMLPMAHREQNPFLGWRGVRILLDKPDVLQPQLRALLRASAFGRVRILVPMITNLDEVHAFQALLDNAKGALRDEGHAFDEQVEVGIMVEVPSVALMAGHFAEHVDFFSIGTNDLTQYALAVDRGNDLVAHKYQELHPAVLHLIHLTVEAGHAQGIDVSVCGELASNPKAAPILVGLGVDALSASPAYLPEVKRVVRAMRFDDVETLARQALDARTPDEVGAMLDQWLDCHACDLAHLLGAGPDPSAEVVDS